MKLRYLLLASVLFPYALSYADGAYLPSPAHQLAVQAAIVTGGNLGIGIVNYSAHMELGATLAGSINNASAQTSLLTPAAFAGFRKELTAGTFFAYGLDVASEFGRKAGASVNADFFLGPYVSIEHMLSKQVLLTGWINPYSYEYEKLAGVSTTTHRVFASGGIGLSYLF